MIPPNPPLRVKFAPRTSAPAKAARSVRGGAGVRENYIGKVAVRKIATA